MNPTKPKSCGPQQRHIARPLLYGVAEVYFKHSKIRLYQQNGAGSQN